MKARRWPPISQGQLLFYTNGEFVFNRQHQVMPNGRKLMGSNSSTQSALIVPDPGSGNVFYLFTVGAQGGPNGLRYSTLDMTRDQGLGDVVRMNALLVSPVAEKLAAVRHQNGRDVWVVAHRWNSNAFVSFLVTPDGVQSKPVMSNVGSMHAGPGRNAIGAMKFSPDGTQAGRWPSGAKPISTRCSTSTAALEKWATYAVSAPTPKPTAWSSHPMAASSTAPATAKAAARPRSTSST